MTYADLLEKLSKFSPKELEQTAVVYLAYSDEFLPVQTVFATNEHFDEFDEGQKALTIKF